MMNRYFRENCRPLSDEDVDRANLENLGEMDDKSCGCVVFRTGPAGVLQCLMINGSNYWAFPKGHPDEGESEKAAALRETREETGLELIMNQISDFRLSVGYTFIKRLHNDKWKKHADYPELSKRPILVTHKIVEYFYVSLSASESSIIQERTEEAKAVKWVNVDEVMGRLQHDEEKGVFERMLEHYYV